MLCRSQAVVVGVKDLNLTKIAKEELNEINTGDFLSKE